MKSVGLKFARKAVLAGISFSLMLGAGLRVDASIGTALQMQLGNPSGATTNTANTTNYLVLRTVEALSYNDNLHEPNWASWDLTASDVGSSGRSSLFYADTNLPGSFYVVQPTDYSGSGYDRGHMCPSADRTDNTTDNDLVFFMSNIIPQTPDNNQGLWANLETDCRTLAQAGNELLIICGPSGFGAARTSSAGQVYIPAYTWKIIVVVPTGSGTALSRITNATRVIAVNIPNIAGIRSDPWANYVTSVNQIQTNTGFTFFTALPQNVAEVLRAKVDGAATDGITTFTPTNGVANTSVVITGTNLTAAAAVEFNGSKATFTVNSNTKITAVVPVSATTGKISVIAPGGLATSSASFIVQATPKLVVALTNLHNLIISWPTNFAGFALQKNSSGTTTNWVNVTNTASLVGTNNQIIFPAAAGNYFFRLQHP